MNIESIPLRIEEEANDRQADVFIKLLESLDKEVKETKNDGACMKHEGERARYAAAAIRANRVKRFHAHYNGYRNELLIAIGELEAARKKYRIAVYQCGCSDKYTQCGNKKTQVTIKQKKHKIRSNRPYQSYFLGDDSRVINRHNLEQ